ncbi:MAG: hypothetical protein VW378_01875 [bacterium]
MKKILIISWYFPPNSSIGSQRVKAFAEFLIQKGHPVYVITVKHNNSHDQTSIPEGITKMFEVKEFNFIQYLKQKLSTTNVTLTKIKKEQGKGGSRTKLKIQKYVKSWIRTICYWPDASFLWFFLNKSKFQAIINDIKPDIIFSSATPHTCHLIAGYLSKKNAIPWVAEFRDLWSQNNVWKRAFPLNLLDRWIEKKVMKPASFLATVSETLKKDLEFLHKKECLTVMNGFTLKKWQEVVAARECSNTNEIVIRYMGKLYDGRRCPKLLFDALNEIKLKKINIKLEFYVMDPDYLYELLSQYSQLSGCISIHPVVSYEESLSLQQTADINLLLEENTLKAKGNLTGKLFEYLCAKRPILAIAHPESEIKTVLDETRMGQLLNNKSEIIAFLEQKVTEKELAGKCLVKINKKNILMYSREAQYEILYKKLKQV